MTRRTSAALALAALLAGTAGAQEMLEYADPAGTIATVPVERVNKEDEKDFSARVVIGGRARRLDIPSRLVISFRRGDQDSENQWSKRLATGKRLYATGQLATQATPPVPGAEETFERITYTTEKGLPGEEAEYGALAWHNEYALFYLIETRYKMGLLGDKAKLTQALADIEEFRARSAKNRGTSMDWDVPAEKGAKKKAKVFCWGDSRLYPDVLLLEAKILAALGEKEKALAAFDAVIDRAKKNNSPPRILTEAATAKADFEATGLSSDQQEGIYRAAGATLAALAKNQPDAFGKQAVTLAANRALLRGADLLRESAEQGKGVSWDAPLTRYQQLESGEGQADPALRLGARAGAGACLVEKGQGEAAYKALLGVIVGGQAEPDQMALCLYYMGRAAKLFGDEIERTGGKGEFLRAETARWWDDLKARYPTSRWAEKAK